MLSIDIVAHFLRIVNRICGNLTMCVEKILMENQKILKKGVDKWGIMWYNYRTNDGGKSKMSCKSMPVWRNRQTQGT